MYIKMLLTSINNLPHFVTQTAVWKIVVSLSKQKSPLVHKCR